MRLSDQQFLFAIDLSKLILFAYEQGDKITLGEGFRTKDQQLLYYYGKKLENTLYGDLVFKKTRVLTKTIHSAHMDRLAQDLNFFIKKVLIRGKEEIITHELTYEKQKIQKYGRYWKTLNKKNVWGGDFKGYGREGDAGHFERSKHYWK